MLKRNNINDFLEILKSHGINKLYHFTDRDNLDSIVENGGLFSWADCEEKGIEIKKPGGSLTSHNLDSRNGLQHYVRLSFTPKHPMMYVAMNDGRITNPIILEISLDVIGDSTTKFSDRNETKNGAQVGGSLEDFKAIHFHSVKANTHFDIEPEEQQFFQAEVLVKNFVPLSSITNLDKFGVSQRKVHNQPLTRFPYTAQITRQTPTAFIFLVDHSVSMERKTLWNGEEITLSEAVARIVNNQLNELILRCVKADEVRHYFDIAIIGYGTDSYSALEGELKDKWFVSPQQLRDNPYKTITVREEKRTRKGPVVKEVSKIQWVEANHSGSWTYLHEALGKAKTILNGWLKDHAHQICYPPTIINITDGEYNGADNELVLQLANELKSMGTDDGNVIFFNIHVTPNSNEKVLFPANQSELPESSLAKKLFQLSSVLPERYNQDINDIKQTKNGVRYRAMGVNVDLATLVKIMDIGTPTNIRHV